jgi:hypothetical protein
MTYIKLNHRLFLFVQLDLSELYFRSVVTKECIFGIYSIKSRLNTEMLSNKTSTTSTTSMSERHCITIDSTVYDSLKQRGKFGQSFNDVISELLEKAQSGTND